MSDDALACLVRQYETSWRLVRHHLEELGTEECLWRPARTGPHVERAADGNWRADWPDRESYDLGPPSIAWLTWHLGFWWSMVLDHSFGAGTLTRESVMWPGTADALRSWIFGLEAEWRGHLESLSPEELRSTGRTRWPMRDRPFCDIVAWVNLELMKNAAEIGYARFLYAVRERATKGR